MGMDVFGENPTTKEGKHFRRNVWGWHPLWQYVENVHPEIAELVEHGHSNSGDGLGEVEAYRLAELLTKDLQNGTVDEYVRQRNEWVAGLPREACGLCDSTGIRTDKVGVDNGMPERVLDETQAIVLGRTKGWCNGCNGEGSRPNFETNYDLERQDVEEFATFLYGCGGFKIC